MSRWLPLVLLTACTANPSTQYGPPIVLDADPMEPGQSMTLYVNGVDAGDRVYFVRSSTVGATCPPALGGECVDLHRPVVMGSDVASAAGIAVYTIQVPPNVPEGATMHFQAGVIGPQAAVTNRVSRTTPMTPSLEHAYGPYLAMSEHGSRCAVAADGRLTCWGSQVVASPYTLPDGPFVDVDHDCAVRADGSIACWRGPSPSLGTPWRDFTGSGTGGCAIDEFSMLQCWGVGARAPVEVARYVQNGTSDCAILAFDGSLECDDQGSYGLDQEPDAGPYVDVALEPSVACALAADGQIDCWGAGWDPTEVNPTPPQSMDRLVQVWPFLCGVASSDATLHCWGNAAAVAIDQQLPSRPVDEVHGDPYSLCARFEDGDIECWGEGRSTAGPQVTATQVSVSGFVGMDGFCALDEGAMTCVSHGGWGQSYPGPFTDVAAVGGTEVCGLLETGDIECHGQNLGTLLIEGPFVSIDGREGALCMLDPAGASSCIEVGSAVFGTAFEATPILALSEISHSGGVACGVRQDNDHVLCWGDIPSSAPPPPTVPVHSLTMSFQHACAIRSVDGVPICWGWGNSATATTVPGGLSDVVALTTGWQGAGFGAYSCALLADRSLTCWGDGAVVNPTLIPEGRFVSVVGGDRAACAIREDRTLTCWGAWMVDGRAQSFP